MQSLVLTGGLGFIGRFLTRWFRRRYRVHVVDCRDSDGPLDGVAYHRADLTQADEVRRVLQAIADREAGVDFVVHLAGFYSLSDDPDPRYESINVGTASNLCEALCDLGLSVQRVIVTSSLFAMGGARPGERLTEDYASEPFTEYGRAKQRTERVVLSYADRLPVVVFRLGAVYDEQQQVLQLAMLMDRAWVGSLLFRLAPMGGKGGVPYVHLEDLARAVDAGLQRREAVGRVFIVSEPGMVPYRELLGELFGRFRRIRMVSMPRLLCEQSVRWVHWFGGLVGHEFYLQPYFVRMMYEHYDVDTGRARRLLGWRPAHRFRDGLSAMVGNYRHRRSKV